MKSLSLLRKNKEVEYLCLFLFLFLILSITASATTSDAPWDKMLNKIIGHLTGSTARLISILALAFAGYKIIWGNVMEGGSWFMKVIVGASVIFGAASWGPYFMGYSGALLM
ncbi:MAG: TrbC/VirB2 family protein [Fusobacterium gastrosuis]|uniref:TrbC/VirB2 family protein n=1 Tax=Fusobacterium gastrosuis TaxID=1755100 RepID=UPI0029769BC1|nr:TrbC/VirB2 family protein [Fusobacteriaceae bacterium]MDY4010998.1 TrbC/VirB2 family protein [Fusobacterium gastrosuis]MDY5713550.1 TrbC/VirB2 family protein [Fusobacterium gastrosuis]